MYPEDNSIFKQKRGQSENIEKFKVGDIIKDEAVKGYSSFGCFFEVNNEIDVLVHIQKCLTQE